MAVVAIDLEGPRTGGYSKFDTLEKIVTEQGDPFRIENWHEALGDKTAETIILPMTWAEARALTKYKDTAKLELFLELQDQGAPMDEERSLPVVTLEGDKQVALDGLEGKLDEAIKSFGDRGAFVRLSTRSPKDAALSGARVREIIKAERQKQQTGDDANDDMMAFVRAISFALKVTSGREAMRLLGESDRVNEDVCMCELMKQEEFDINIVVRAWEDIEPELEFRTFIYNGEMTAIGQYTPIMHVPWIVEHKDEIAERLRSEFYTSLKGLLPTHDTYVLDLALRYDDDVVRVIEVNNPPPIAGVPLFDWDDAADRRVIEQGPFEIRVVEEPVKDSYQKIYTPLADYLLQMRGMDTRPLHAGIPCSRCGVGSIRGPKFTCQSCADILCYECYCTREHVPSHKFAYAAPPEPVEATGGCVVL